MQRVAKQIYRFVNSIWGTIAGFALLVGVVWSPLAGVTVLTIASWLVLWGMDGEVQRIKYLLRHVRREIARLSQAPSPENSRAVIAVATDPIEPPFPVVSRANGIQYRGRDIPVQEVIQYQGEMDSYQEGYFPDIAEQLRRAIEGMQHTDPVEHHYEELCRQLQSFDRDAKWQVLHGHTQAAISNGYKAQPAGDIHWIKTTPVPESIATFPQCRPVYNQLPPTFFLTAHSLDSLLQVYFPAQNSVPLVWTVGESPAQILSDTKYRSPLAKFCLRSTLGAALEYAREDPIPEKGGIYTLVQVIRSNCEDLLHPFCEPYSAYYFITRPVTKDTFQEMFRNVLRLAFTRKHTDIIVTQECLQPIMPSACNRCVSTLKAEAEFRVSQRIYFLSAQTLEDFQNTTSAGINQLFLPTLLSR